MVVTSGYRTPLGSDTADQRWRLEEQPAWTWDVTARDLRSLRVHRWFFFPHSFAPALVANLTCIWGLGADSVVADPYCGAGTTLVAAQWLGYNVTGWDISPLAVLASQVKLAQIESHALTDAWTKVSASVRRQRRTLNLANCDELIRRALPEDTLTMFLRIWSTIGSHASLSAATCSNSDRSIIWDALRLAVIAELPRFSRLVRKGGWLAHQEPLANASEVLDRVSARVQLMAFDLADVPSRKTNSWKVQTGDARALPIADGVIDAIITSPPYPNRHDYTRMFGVELTFGFLGHEAIREIRYQSVSSHPEAKPVRPESSKYRQPPALTAAITEIGNRISDTREKTRIPGMIAGYFLDLWLSLRESYRILKPGGHAAFVVGNARYKGVTLEVDTLLAELAESVSLEVNHIYVARRRGNSAQQMKVYGRQPQRESVVILRRP
jgi:tRNA G10  N-methylase Trm11